MKHAKNYSKIIISAVIMLLLSLSGYAQQAYRGGMGDGYAMGETAGIFVSVEEINSPPLLIFPNPVTQGEDFNIQLLNTYSLSITVSDIQGNALLYFNTSAENFAVNTKGLLPGIYIVTVSNPVSVYTARMVII